MRRRARKKRRFQASSACFISTAVLLASCQDQTTGPVNGTGEIVFPDSNVSYSAHVQPLFDRRCNASGCHDSGTRAGDLSLQSYVEATERPGMIVPGEPDGSILVQSIEGILGRRMPLSSTPLLENQIKGIRQWVLEGARNN